MIPTMNGRPTEIRAISLTQPWPWIAIHLGKSVENRTRSLGDYRGPVLLHAAAGAPLAEWHKARDFVVQRFGAELMWKIPRPFLDVWGNTYSDKYRGGRFRRNPELVQGAVIGVATITNRIEPGFKLVDKPAPSSWQITRSPRDWYMGAHGYLWESIRALQEPIPCKGALGLWRPPASVVTAAWHLLVDRRDYTDFSVAMSGTDS